MWAPGLLLTISTVLLGVCQLPLASVMFAVFCCWSPAAFCLLWPTFRQRSSPSKCSVWWAKNRMVVTTKMTTGENKKDSSDWRAIRGWIGHSNYKTVNECESPTHCSHIRKSPVLSTCKINSTVFMAPHCCGFCCRSFSTWWAIMGQHKDFKEIQDLSLLTTSLYTNTFSLRHHSLELPCVFRLIVLVLNRILK